MPFSPRAAELRAAMEDALAAPVQLAVVDGVARLRAPAPPGRDSEAWQRVIAALGTADAWGSSGTDDAPVIWAEIEV